MLQWCRLSEEKWNSLEVTEIAVGQCKVKESHYLTTFCTVRWTSWAATLVQCKIVVEGSRAIML